MKSCVFQFVPDLGHWSGAAEAAGCSAGSLDGRKTCGIAWPALQTRGLFPHRFSSKLASAEKRMGHLGSSLGLNLKSVSQSEAPCLSTRAPRKAHRSFCQWPCGFLKVWSFATVLGLEGLGCWWSQDWTSGQRRERQNTYTPILRQISVARYKCLMWCVCEGGLKWARVGWGGGWHFVRVGRGWRGGWHSVKLGRGWGSAWHSVGLDRGWGGAWHSVGVGRGWGGAWLSVGLLRCVLDEYLC